MQIRKIIERGYTIVKNVKVKRFLAALITTSLVCGTTAVAAESVDSVQDTKNTAEEVIDNTSESILEDTKGEVSEEAATDSENLEDKVENTQEDKKEEVKETSEADVETVTDSEKEESSEKEETSDEEELSEEEGIPDARTAELAAEFAAPSSKLRAAVGTYESELKKFPSSYQTLLKELHKKHPNWIFVAKNTGLTWNDVVKNESISGKAGTRNPSLLPKTSASLLLSKANTDYNASKGTYVPKDSSVWVSASRPAVAYYVDPRNFLTEEYIFLFEALDFNTAYHTESGVENVLKGTDLYKKKIEYINTEGQTVPASSLGNVTYGKTIFGAGKREKVSPLFLASKIRQETGGDLDYKSISGKTKFGSRSYIGYYNYYNIGASSSTTISPVEKGLQYAKNKGWISPILAIDGGAEYIAQSYIKKGQNTVYYERFNTAVKPYYEHQYMTNLTGAASEANATYKSYKSMGILDNRHVFYIPVYKSMPSQSAKVTISKSVKKGTTTTSATMRKGASAYTSSLGAIPKGAAVTVSGGVYTDKTIPIASQQTHPYWVKVTYGSKTGYISANYLKMNTNSTIKAGSTKQLSVSAASGETVYYETSNPAVATVSTSGKITGVKSGTCMIYAVSSSGKTLDVIGIAVNGSQPSTSKPSTSKPSAAKKYITYKTSTKVNYRSGAGTSYSVKGSLSSGKTISVESGYSKKANGYTWYRFKLSGKNYYVASKYLKKVTSSSSSNRPSAKKYTKYKTSTKVNYRSGAGTSYSKKGTLASGKTIEVENGYSKKANGYTWYRFKLGGKNYYVASKYVKKVSTSSSSSKSKSVAKKYNKYKTKAKVNYRAGAGTSYKVRGTLAKGKSIMVESGYSRKANSYTWYRFKLGSKSYYIASKYLKRV